MLNGMWNLWRINYVFRSWMGIWMRNIGMRWWMILWFRRGCGLLLGRRRWILVYRILWDCVNRLGMCIWFLLCNWNFAGIMWAMNCTSQIIFVVNFLFMMWRFHVRRFMMLALIMVFCWTKCGLTHTFKFVKCKSRGRTLINSYSLKNVCWQFVIFFFFLH